MGINSSAATLVPPDAWTAGDGAELVVESHGPHVLIRHRDEQPWERSILVRYLARPGEVVVLASAGAHRMSSLPGVVSSVLSGVLAQVDPLDPVFGYRVRVTRVWLAVSGIVGDPARGTWLHRMADQFGVELLAPHGSLVLVPGGALFAAGKGGRAGWLWYRPNVPVTATTPRYPVPYWDNALPWQPLAVGGLIADPVPAGLAVRAVGAPPFTSADLAFAVPADGRQPKLVLGRPCDRPVAPGLVARLIDRLGPAVRSRLVLVPATGSIGARWLQELADALDHDIVSTCGIEVVDRSGARKIIAFGDDGNQAFRPFGTVLCHRPGLPAAEVVEIAPSPTGWSRCGPRHYRPDEANSPVRAEVTPAGMLLSLGNGSSAPMESPVQGCWTVTLGSPGEQVTEPLIQGLGHLLAGLHPDQLRTVRIRVAGTVGSLDDLRLLELADDAGVSLELPTPLAHLESDPDSTITIRIPGALPAPSTGDAATQAIPAPPRSRPATVDPPNAMAGTPSTARPVTESGAPGPRPGDHPQAGPAGSERTADPVIPAQQPLAPPRTTASVAERPETEEFAPRPAQQPPAPAGVPVVTSSVPVEVVSRRVEPVYLAGSRLDDRPSGLVEQDQFAGGVAGEFNEALATVNSALATWPALRAAAGAGDDRAVKVDYVAVCLYLGEGRHGAVALNSALRGGGEPARPGYLPCLVSGLRRLPTERRPVMRQARIGAVVDEWYPVGLVITEPGFLSASMASNIAVVGADVDFLIWPRSARRTSALARGRDFAEAVFFAGSRFRVLAVRTVEREAVSDAYRPRVAVLLRELLPHEEVEGRALDADDEETLGKLDHALAERHSLALRVLDDPALAGRWAGAPVGVGEPGAAPAAAQMTGAGG